MFVFLFDCLCEKVVSVSHISLPLSLSATQEGITSITDNAVLSRLSRWYIIGSQNQNSVPPCTKGHLRKHGSSNHSCNTAVQQLLLYTLKHEAF